MKSNHDITTPLLRFDNCSKPWIVLSSQFECLWYRVKQSRMTKIFHCGPHVAYVILIMSDNGFLHSSNHQQFPEPKLGDHQYPMRICRWYLINTQNISFMSAFRNVTFENYRRRVLDTSNGNNTLFAIKYTSTLVAAIVFGGIYLVFAINTVLFR